MVGKRNRLRGSLTALTLLASPLASAAETQPLNLRSGRRLEARLDFPRHVKGRTNPQRLPVLLVFGGFQNAGAVIELLREAHLGDGYILASFDYPFDPPRKLLFPESLFWIPKLHQMVHDTFEGMQLLATVLERDPRVDPTRRIALGASLGAPMVLGAVARGAPVTHLVMVHGFGKLRQTIAWQLERPWLNSWGFWRFAAPGIAGGISHLLLWQSGLGEAEEWVSRLPEGLPVLSIRASEDVFVPPDAVDSLEESLLRSRVSLSLMKTTGGHLQPGATKTLHELRVQIQSWLLNQSRKHKPGNHQSDARPQDPKR